MTAESLNLCLLHIDGVDAIKFLQSQLTCDVLAIQPGLCQLTAYCNHQGYVISLFWLGQSETGFSALMPMELSEPTLALFKKYGAFSKVTFQVEALAWTLEEALHWQRAPLTLPALMPQQATPNANWRAYWLALGIPTLSLATSGLFRPQELNLPELNAVSFTKGCYPGQEIVARMHYRGKAKSHLQRVILTSEVLPEPGSTLLVEETPIGTAVDALWLDGKQIAVQAVMNDTAYSQLPLHCQFGELTAWQDSV